MNPMIGGLWTWDEQQAFSSDKDCSSIVGVERWDVAQRHKPVFCRTRFLVLMYLFSFFLPHFWMLSTQPFFVVSSVGFEKTKIHCCMSLILVFLINDQRPSKIITRPSKMWLSSKYDWSTPPSLFKWPAFWKSLALYDVAAKMEILYVH